MYKPEFNKQHQHLSELVSWLTTWQKYTQTEKRSAEENEPEQSIKRKRSYTNGHGEHNTQ